MDEVLFARTVSCPVCSGSFKTTKIKEGKIKFVKRDTDMFRHFEGLSPYLYEINVCPECGFSFSDSNKYELTDTQIRKVAEIISTKWNKHDYGGERTVMQAVEAYKLALLSAQVVSMKDSVLAGICMRICWLNRMAGNDEEEKKYMKGAVEFFEKVYDKEDLSGSEGLGPEMVVYLLGELNYRLGNHSDAVKWFNIALSKYNNNPDVKKQTINMIRDRWLEIKGEVVK